MNKKINDILEYLNEVDTNTTNNANDLWKSFNWLPNKLQEIVYTYFRKKQYKVGTKFCYNNLTYEILSCYRFKGKLFSFYVDYFITNYDGQLAPSGRPLKRSGTFGLSSTMDLTLVFKEEERWINIKKH
jgi:hypothetical protein